MSNRELEIARDPTRLSAVRDTGLLDSPPEQAFDRVTRTASRILGTNGSLVTLLDQDRQYLKNSHGLPQPWASHGRTPLSHSHCKFVLADAMDLSVVAEGIETELQLRCLRDLGCQIGQGYYFSRPVPEDEFGKLLQTLSA